MQTGHGRPVSQEVMHVDLELQKVKEVRGQGKLMQVPELLRKEA